MRRLIFWQYILVAAAWCITIFALPLPAASLNRFLTWHGDVTTQGLLLWLFSLPPSVARDWTDPSIRAGVRAGGKVAAATFAFGDLLWLAAVLLGLLFFLFAPLIVRRHNACHSTTQTIVRCLAPVLLVLPATLFAPQVWGFPAPRIGMYLLGSAHLLVCAALMMTSARAGPESAFPVLPKAA